jgi:hypothetical protein
MKHLEIIQSIKSIPTEAVKGMLAKAEHLLGKGCNAIVSVPGNAKRDTFIVESHSGKPHFVVVKRWEKLSVTLIVPNGVESKYVRILSLLLNELAS